MFYRYAYVPGSKPFLFQGTQAELQRKLQSTGAIVVSGGNGSYLLAIPSKGTIYEYTSEAANQPIRSICPNKDIVRRMYGKERVTENDYNQMTNDLNQGKFSFDILCRPY